MEGNKSALASKTVWAGLALIIFNVLAALGVLPAELTQEVAMNAINGVLALLAIIFRWNSTQTIGTPPTK